MSKTSSSCMHGERVSDMGLICTYNGTFILDTVKWGHLDKQDTLCCSKHPVFAACCIKPMKSGHASLKTLVCPRGVWIGGSTDQSSTNLHIVDNKLVESIGHHVTCLLVGAIPNTGHQILTLEPSTNSVVNTFRLPPIDLSKEGWGWGWHGNVVTYFSFNVTLQPRLATLHYLAPS